jgi:hypothetical protein
MINGLKKAADVFFVLLPLASLGQGKQKDSASYCFETYRLPAPPEDSAGPRKSVLYVVIKKDSTLFLLPMAGVNDLGPQLSTIKRYRLHYEMTVGVLLQTDSGRKKIDEQLKYTAVDLADTTARIRMFISTRRHNIDEHIRSGAGPERYIFFEDLKRHPATGGGDEGKPRDPGDSTRRRLEVTPRDPKNPLIPITITQIHITQQNKMYKLTTPQVEACRDAISHGKLSYNASKDNYVPGNHRRSTVEALVSNKVLQVLEKYQSGRFKIVQPSVILNHKFLENVCK